MYASTRPLLVRAWQIYVLEYSHPRARTLTHTNSQAAGNGDESAAKELKQRGDERGADEGAAHVPSEDVPLEDQDLEKLGYTKWKQVDVEAVDDDTGQESKKERRERKDKATGEGKSRLDVQDKAKGNQHDHSKRKHTDKARKTKKGHLQLSKPESSKV